jgi:O-acetylserine/cysteine efflux transporter
MLKRLGDVGGFIIVTWIAVLATPQLFIASFIFESDQLALIKSAPFESWLAVAYLGLIMTAVGYAMWYHLLGRYPVSRVMPFLLLLPVVAVIGGIVFLGEMLTIKIAAGGLLSLIGVAIITMRAQAQS